MNLFSKDILESMEDEEETNPKRKRKASSHPHSVRARYDGFKQFALALRQRDRQVLNFLLSDRQESKHWETKQEFVDKYLECCNRFESEGEIVISTHEGMGRQKNIPVISFSALEVVVDSAQEGNRLWRFTLILSTDDLREIRITQCNRFFQYSHYLPPKYSPAKKQPGVTLMLPLA